MELLTATQWAEIQQTVFFLPILRQVQSIPNQDEWISICNDQFGEAYSLQYLDQIREIGDHMNQIYFLSFVAPSNIPLYQLVMHLYHPLFFSQPGIKEYILWIGKIIEWDEKYQSILQTEPLDHEALEHILFDPIHSRLASVTEPIITALRKMKSDIVI